ncbi:immunity protein 7 of polymorphic toxin system [Pseudomonas sp. SLBN-26]|uniref:Imm7 family immunity protein n=1 Tax=Pseudomonadaceae TaxID=135621 RepID=UPI001151FD5E|nr:MULTISPECIES: Imm7 family immunity protein [Pseudomonas]MCP1619873.1 hypothetical protein [Pseudomonas otitidis]TQL09094.1 immunity protein 7 of polymorphic toxin system [Pseudomonas sp. SLBN-26]
MYEFHGWIKLSESPSEMDEGGLDQKVKKFKNELSSFGWSSGRGEILLMNGVYTLVLNAIPNRRRTEAEDLQKIVDIVTKDFAGAYGLIYEYDEQASTEYGRGVFSVRVIKRGKCEVFLDPFLSPVIPVVEGK